MLRCMESNTQTNESDGASSDAEYMEYVVSASAITNIRDTFARTASIEATKESPVQPDAFLKATSRITVQNPSFGRSPTGFRRIHLEMLPREVARLVGYDPRSLVMKPRKPGAKVARGTRDLVPHNVAPTVIALQNQVQRSIDKGRVQEMVDYLVRACTEETFADWGAIELVTTSEPMDLDSAVALDVGADYFIADGQHRYCALLDFCQQHPEYCDVFTQGITMSVLPEGRLVEWAGQKFHDHNYFSVAVRPGKALAVDSRDPINALAKSLDQHATIKKAGGIAYERDTLLAGDARLTTHAVIHRFVRGFLFGRPGLDGRGPGEARADIEHISTQHLKEYLLSLGQVMPWFGDHGENREDFLARSSAVFAALAVVGHDLFHSGLSYDEIGARIALLGRLDWHRRNLEWVGILGSEKDGKVQPGSSRPIIDGTIRYLRERLGLLRSRDVS